MMILCVDGKKRNTMNRQRARDLRRQSSQITWKNVNSVELCNTSEFQSYIVSENKILYGYKVFVMYLQLYLHY